MKNIVAVVAVILTIISATSCTTTEKCWAYKDIKQVKQKHYKGSASATHKPKRNKNLKSGSCYNFN